jgi:hypothetical protein
MAGPGSDHAAPHARKAAARRGMDTAAASKAAEGPPAKKQRREETPSGSGQATRPPPLPPCVPQQQQRQTAGGKATGAPSTVEPTLGPAAEAAEAAETRVTAAAAAEAGGVRDGVGMMHEGEAGATSSAAGPAAADSAPTAADSAPAAPHASAAAATARDAGTADAPPAKKPRKARAPPPPPEYEEVWRDVYLSGTEWEQQRQVLEYDWDFSHLDEALTSGALKDAPMVHLFGASEPQLVVASEDDTAGSVIPIPVIVAVVSTRPPPAVVGIKSVQRAEEEIIPMANIRMGWHARPPDNAPKRNAPKATLFVLKCTERRARLRNMDEEAVHKYDYVLPYIIRPGQNDEDAPDTNVQVLVDKLEDQTNPVMLEFDYEMDDLDEFVAELIEEQELDAAKHTEPMKTAIRAAVTAQKLKYKAEKEARKARLDDISPEERESIAGMKLYKFYPSNEEEKYPDVTGHKSKYINRYYGQADMLF